MTKFKPIKIRLLFFKVTIGADRIRPLVEDVLRIIVSNLPREARALVEPALKRALDSYFG